MSTATTSVKAIVPCQLLVNISISEVNLKLLVREEVVVAEAATHI